MYHRLFSNVAMFLLLGLGAIALAAEIQVVDLSPHDFHLYRYYLDAIEHESLAGKSQAQKLKLIAKDQHLSVRSLKKIITAGSKFGNREELAGKIEAAITDGLKRTTIKDRVKSVFVDASSDSEYNAIAYVQWKARSRLDYELEACEVAAVVKRKGPPVYTLSIAAVRGETQVFTAAISHENMQKISAARCESFAKTRYIRLFEKVKGL